MIAANNRPPQIETSPTVPHGPGIAARLAHQWPKVAILFGILLTFAWVTVLGWMAIFVLDLL